MIHPAPHAWDLPAVPALELGYGPGAAAVMMSAGPARVNDETPPAGWRPAPFLGFGEPGEDEPAEADEPLRWEGDDG